MSTLPPLERGLTILTLAAANKDGITWKAARQAVGNVSPVTISRLLSVLTDNGYLIHTGGRYLSGPNCTRLVPAKNEQELLERYAQEWAEEVRTRMGQSAVLAVRVKDAFRFAGVANIDGGLGYMEPGTVVADTRSHVITLLYLSLAEKNTTRLRARLESLIYTQGVEPPDTADLLAEVESGRQTGLYCEYAWTRPACYRGAVPLFSRSNELIGVFFCGHTQVAEFEKMKNDILALGMEFNERLCGSPDNTLRG